MTTLSPFLTHQPNPSCSWSRSCCFFSHPRHSGACLIPRKQEPVLWCWERKAALLLRVHTIHTDGRFPIPVAPGQWHRLHFSQQQLFAFLLLFVTLFAAAFNQTRAGHHTHSKSKIHYRQLNIWNKMISNGWENSGQHLHVPGRQQYRLPKLLQVSRAHVILGRLLFPQVTPFATSGGGCNSAQHFCTGLEGMLWTDHTVNINYIPKYDWHSWVKIGSSSPKTGLVQTLQESTHYKAMKVCLRCIYKTQISLMLIYLSTCSLGLYFLPDADKLFLQS